MKISLLITLCCVLFLSGQVLAEGDNDIKKGVYPFMAYIYYPDERVVEAPGVRFLRGAVLVKPNWLITSSVGAAIVNDLPHGFPRKTLLARLGAVSIDSKFTISEEEDEQEREVIQIVRPFNQSSTQWWRTDITLLKTLLPFNVTDVVSPGTLRQKYSVNDSSCFFLAYIRRSGNSSEDRLLTQFSVDVLPEGSECGNHFFEETMLCANDNEENKVLATDPESCNGVSGGPLVCDNEIAGIQTYVENNCKQPHLYQHLAAWDSFIKCGIEDKCQEGACSQMCIVANKDDPSIEENTTEDPTTRVVAQDLFTLTEEITMPSSTNKFNIYDEIFTAPSPSVAISQTDKEDPPTTTTTAPKSDHTKGETEQSSSWPKEKYPKPETSLDEENKNIERKTNVEAQQHNIKTKARGAAERNMCYLQSFFSVFILACIV